MCINSDCRSSSARRGRLSFFSAVHTTEIDTTAPHLNTLGISEPGEIISHKIKYSQWGVFPTDLLNRTRSSRSKAMAGKRNEKIDLHF